MNKLAFACALLAVSAVAPAAERTASPAFVALSVADLDASVQWYTTMFDLQATRVRESEKFRIALLRGQDLIVELLQHADAAPPSVPRRFLLHGQFKAGFFVDDLDKTVARLRDLGAEFRGDVVTDDVVGARTILVVDNAGNILQLFQWLPDE